ncbi:hypothetical protein [Cellulosimicrobium sp. I38E]|uniref:hypothetical protein n=1 Tax=Cellulosimicrobium sp. I38E TaxID=1393139 RepID=UPI0007B2E6A9|nr:hypothetical protein [Cellulosimicrobium sp. I38E]KZM77569.1 hypothetical protein A0J59_03850 [Cellulosimicrobium sp. I38E]
MNSENRMPDLDPVFADALRGALVAQASVAAPRRPARRRWWAGVGALGALAVAGGTAYAVTALVEPGGTVVTRLAGPVEVTRAGTSTVELGPRPDGATHVELSLVCLDAGRFVLEDGANMTCSTEDAQDQARRLAAGEGAGMGWSVVAVPGDESVRVEAEPGARWHLVATYVDETVTAWATNANGDTYGVANDTGWPDLVSVYATNGRVGYAFARDLEDAQGGSPTSPEEAAAWQEEREGKAISVPVYESDGETVIGELVVGG